MLHQSLDTMEVVTMHMVLTGRTRRMAVPARDSLVGRKVRGVHLAFRERGAGDDEARLRQV